jgi:hypothetical protein
MSKPEQVLDALSTHGVAADREPRRLNRLLIGRRQLRVFLPHPTSDLGQ